MIYRLVLLVLLDVLRRHPQEQYVHTTALEKWFYCLSERDMSQFRANTNSYRSWSDVFSGRGCAGPESTSAQYVAYGETTVHPYLCIFYLSPVLGTFNSTSSFTPKRANMPGQDSWLTQIMRMIHILIRGCEGRRCGEERY
jgi:hypothetical protein